MTAIREIRGYELLDSRGNPTVATLTRYAAVLGVRVVFGAEPAGGPGRT